jgi:rod shape-determining protein MreC
MSRNVAASKKPVWITLAVALVVHAALISVQGRHRVDTSFLRAWLMDALAPAEKLADRSLLGVRTIWDRYVWLVGVHDDNQRLKRENDDLRMKLMAQQEAVLEAARIRELAGLQEAAFGKSVVARVIGSDSGRGQTVTIDKGKVHGIRPDVAVITAHGIVGRVIHASNFFSIVQLIIDSQSAVGVMLQSNRRQGIVKGAGNRDLDLDYIDDDNDLKEGDVFLTSGQDRVYPKGLPVGVILSVGPRRGLLKTVQIRPSADLGRLEEVLCVLDRKENEEFDSGEGPTVP